MAIFDFIGDKSTSGGLPGALARIALRFLQLVFAITVAGLYAPDLHLLRQAQDPKHEDHVFVYSRWVFAEVVAILSIITVLVYAVPFIKSWWGFAWDWCLFILWTALFGVFARVFIPFPGSADGYADPKDPTIPIIIRMKHAVWIDLVNMLLWLITAIYTTVIWFRNRGSGRTLHTGRGQI
ncbi:hypothetical protein LTR56_018279 [Elasticomyces elasticus]|nr:hypothetical protein LTR56_018279 [Elasticomyces elasticus]KAK3636769.1 hypothetical protein LTR22_018584 [Elasticomyces elasticus]KAK4912367.1 hypothetical protein LTR49_019185 [Elasticomyces elasticus]KAK5751838.1 hypothetical protein LTS12_018079 [Elasticomyces elasticus]